MAPTPPLPETTPFPPGESPFRVKGISYKSFLEHMEVRAPGGAAAVIAALPDPALRAFFGQRFLVGSWYDILPIAPLHATAAKLLGMSEEAFGRMQSRYQADKDINGIYRILLKLASPAGLLQRMPALTAQYQDFSRSSVEMVDKKSARAVYEGMPRMLLPWYLPATEAYTVRVLECAGAKRPRMTIHPPEPYATVRTVETIRLRIDIAWD